MPLHERSFTSYHLKHAAKVKPLTVRIKPRLGGLIFHSKENCHV